MCRNIKTLYNFKPPATKDEIRASSLQWQMRCAFSVEAVRQPEISHGRTGQIWVNREGFPNKREG